MMQLNCSHGEPDVKVETHDVPPMTKKIFKKISGKVKRKRGARSNTYLKKI